MSPNDRWDLIPNSSFKVGGGGGRKKEEKKKKKKKKPPTESHFVDTIPDQPLKPADEY